MMTERYRTGDTPWDTGTPSPILLEALAAGELPGPRLLEFGCGTGTNAVELARRGYQVTAVDLVEQAIEQARRKATEAGVRIKFLYGDLTKLDLGGPFDSVFDMGVYHGIRQRNLAGFLATARRVTRPGSRWLSVAGNAREPHPNGPPVVSEEEIRRELSSGFTIKRLTETHLELGPELRPLAWSILLERRSD